MRRDWTLDEVTQCELMNYAVQKAHDVLDRLGERVGHRYLRALSLETTTLTPAHRDDEPAHRSARVRSIEVSLLDAVWEVVLAMAATDPFAAAIVVAIAGGAKWSSLSRKDPHRRGEKMLGYVRLNALWRMWQASGARLLPMMLDVEPRLYELIEVKMRKRTRR